jgi:magnesium-transporting ATPase (P-type)
VLLFLDFQFLFVFLIIMGMVSMIDPPRETVPIAIEACREAHIKIVIIT